MITEPVVQEAAKPASPTAQPTEMPAGCGMSGLLETLTRPWTLHIMWLLSRNGPMRFGAMRRNIDGISARLLTLRLRTLEEKGFVRRTVKPTNPPHVTYSPTSRLKEMDGVMAHLHGLSDKWQQEDRSEGTGIREQGSGTTEEHDVVV